MSTYTVHQIYNALIAAGFPHSETDGTVCRIMDAIAGAESSWLVGCIQQGEPYKTTGWGTWQITPGNEVPSVGVDHELLDLYTNARAAFYLWKTRGFQPWSTYNNGAYKRYLR